jgi:hypothetical protein
MSAEHGWDLSDTSTPEFKEAAHKSSLAAAEHDRKHPEIQQWMDEMSIWDDLDCDKE